MQFIRVPSVQICFLSTEHRVLGLEAMTRVADAELYRLNIRVKHCEQLSSSVENALIVNLASVESAERCLREFSLNPSSNLRCALTFAPSSTRVWVGGRGFTPELSRDSCRLLLQHFGTVVPASSIVGVRGSNSYAFVEFATPQQAEHVVSRLQGIVVASPPPPWSQPSTPPPLGPLLLNFCYDLRPAMHAVPTFIPTSIIRRENADNAVWRREDAARSNVQATTTTTTTNWRHATQRPRSESPLKSTLLRDSRSPHRDSRSRSRSPQSDSRSSRRSSSQSPDTWGAHHAPSDAAAASELTLAVRAIVTTVQPELVKITTLLTEIVGLLREVNDSGSHVLSD